jgi:iduronate 2-sulfatase
VYVHPVLLMMSLLVSCAAMGSVRKSVLMVTSDDLRPQLSGAYGLEQTQTPNLDRLARDGVTFLRAYCQQAVCSPSRNSFMSGRRPDTTMTWNFIDDFRTTPVGGENWVSMPEYFKRHGYLTYASGKLFHPGKPSSNDFPTSWTVDAANPYYWGNGAPIGDQDKCPEASDANVTAPLAEAGWKLQAAPDAPCYNVICTRKNDTAALDDMDERDAPQPQQLVEYDHRVATRAIEFMAHAASHSAPFFIAAGFRKPHVPWRVPHRFWDAYEGAAIKLAEVQTLGRGVPVLAYEMNGPLQTTFVDPQGKPHRESPSTPLPASLQVALRRGYYASVSFLDFEVGRMLDKVDGLGLRNSTAVLFHADHGWKLGEHGAWSKCTNWELDARVPMIFRAPWLGDAARGKPTLAIAELVDLYPTLVELAGLPAPPPSEGLEGISLVPALQNPGAEHASGKVAAFSQYPRCTQYDLTTQSEQWECLHIPKENFTRMGYSVRVADARYTEWRVWSGSSLSADWSAAGLVTAELYDHAEDSGIGAQSFDDFEFDNLAEEAGRKPQVEKLAALLRAQFDAGHAL